MKKFYISTAIDYVNAAPHIGHAYEKICADAIARWHRMKKEDVFFLTGTDENAQKNVQAAKEAGVDVRQFVDENAKKFLELCEKLNISYDDFIRTTQPRHTKACRLIFQKIYDKGDIYKDFYEGHYCQGCEAFITEKELLDGRCPEHHTKPAFIKEESYFFKLSKYQNEILKLLEAGLVEPRTRSNEIINRVKEGLNDLSVSRKNVDWGVNVPVDETHKIYVWMDALINYISGLDYPDGEAFKKYWPADVHLIGKGINWFHSVVWPAMLLSAGVELPKKVFVHGYVNIKGKKISKSLGNAVDPLELVDNYGADALRYFLLREIPFGEDGDFSKEAFERRFNSDLANDLGNLLNRALTMIEKYFDGKVPSAAGKKLSLTKNLKQMAVETVPEVFGKMDEMNFNSALSLIWKLINSANKYIEDAKPWVLAKEDRAGLEEVIYSLFEILRFASVLIWPFMPHAAENMRGQMGLKKISPRDFIEELVWAKSSARIKISKGSPLFPRIK